MIAVDLNDLVGQARALDRNIAVLQAEQAALWGAIRQLGGAGISLRGAIAIIIEAVAEEFGVPRAEILGDRRVARVIAARHACCWLARNLTPMSYPAIARHMRRDHTTVMHSVHAAELRIGRDGQFAHQVATLHAELAARLSPTPTSQEAA